MKKSQTDIDFTGVSLDAFNLYMLEMKHLCRVSDEQEAQLLARVVRGNQASRDDAANHLVLTDALHARNQLLEAYQGIILALARRYHRQCKRLEVLDLLQEGTIGAIEALSRYDGTSPKGGSFKKTLITWIAGTMKEALRTHDYAMRLPSKVNNQIKDFVFARDRLYFSLQRPPLLEEIAADLHCSIDKVRELAEYAHRQNVASLHQSVNEESDSELEEVVSLAPLYDAPAVGSPVRVAAVRAAVPTLPPRQRQIIEMRFGLAEDDGREWSQESVASELAQRRSNIQHGEKGGYANLRKKLAYLYGASSADIPDSVA